MNYASYEFTSGIVATCRRFFPDMARAQIVEVALGVNVGQVHTRWEQWYYPTDGSDPVAVEMSRLAIALDCEFDFRDDLDRYVFPDGSVIVTDPRRAWWKVVGSAS